jgi:hypothetical protein
MIYLIFVFTFISDDEKHFFAPLLPYRGKFCGEFFLSSPLITEQNVFVLLTAEKKYIKNAIAHR